MSGLDGLPALWQDVYKIWSLRHHVANHNVSWNSTKIYFLLRVLFEKWAATRLIEADWEACSSAPAKLWPVKYIRHEILCCSPLYDLSEIMLSKSTHLFYISLRRWDRDKTSFPWMIPCYSEISKFSEPRPCGERPVKFSLSCSFDDAHY